MADSPTAQEERVFPAGYWRTPPEGGGQGARLVRLATTSAGWQDLISIIWQKPEARVIRLLRALMTGVTAETQGAHERADFYFETAIGEFERLCARPRACKALSSSLGVADVREAIAGQLFLETHIGFIASYQALKGDSGRRPAKHARWAERVLKFAGMTAESAAAIRAWLCILETVALQRCGRRQEVLAAFESGLERQSPDYFKDGYVETLYEQTVAALNAGESDPEKQANERALGEALDRFIRTFDNLSDRQLAWERLADLYRRRIAAFSGAESLGTCIGIVQRAVDADPFDLGTQNVDLQLRFALSEQQAQMARIEQEAAAEGKALNDKGITLRNSLMNGFADARSYLASSRAATVQHAARTVWARRLWAALGLSQSDDWQEQALTLMEAIGAALLRCDCEDPSFAPTLGQEMSSRPALRDVDASIVATRFLALRGVPTQPARVADAVIPPMVESCEALPVADRECVPGSEDFADWLFSRQGLLTRWSIAAAVFFVVSATALTGYSRSVESERQALFPRVMAAAHDKNDELVVDLAARFLNRRPISGRGQLDRAVEQVYAEALVNLFATNAGEPSPALIEAAEAYRQLVGQPQEEQQ